MPLKDFYFVLIQNKIVKIVPKKKKYIIFGAFFVGFEEATKDKNVKKNDQKRSIMDNNQFFITIKNFNYKNIKFFIFRKCI